MQPGSASHTSSPAREGGGCSEVLYHSVCLVLWLFIFRRNSWPTWSVRVSSCVYSVLSWAQRGLTLGVVLFPLFHNAQCQAFHAKPQSKPPAFLHSFLFTSAIGILEHHRCRYLPGTTVLVTRDPAYVWGAAGGSPRPSSDLLS